MHRRLMAMLLMALLLWPALGLAGEEPTYTLLAEVDALTLWSKAVLMNQWETPTGMDALADIYEAQDYIYVRVSYEAPETSAMPEETIAPIWLRFEYEEDFLLETLGFVNVRRHDVAALDASEALETLEALAAIPDEAPVFSEEPSAASTPSPLPCGKHLANAVSAEAVALHSSPLPCGQAFACDASHLHMAYECGAHFSCQGGDAAQHERYEACGHFICEGMRHPVLDCRVHSRCDADPLAHAVQPCGHTVCTPCACADEQATLEQGD